MLRKLGISLLALCWLLSAATAYCAEVQLEEIPISLYNKPVTGYRLTLDRSQRFVEQQIIKHIAASDAARPFQYEKTVIYENIRYAPITADQDISLYFLLRGIENQYTEVTLVAMYDYRRSINSREFPELSLKVKVDLARLVRKISGDVLRATDIVFDDETIRKLLTDGLPKKNPPTQDRMGENEAEHRDVVVMPRGGFKESDGGGDTSVAALRRRVEAFEAREQLLRDREEAQRAQQAELDRKQSALQQKLAENKNLRDSIVLLNQRVQALIGQYYVSDDVSISNETAERMFELERENRRQQKRIAQLEHDNDSISTRLAGLLSQMETVAKGRQGMVDDIQRLRADNERLQQEVERLRTDLDAVSQHGSAEANADSLLVQLRAANRRYASIQQEMEALREEQARAIKDSDALLAKNMQLEDRIADLEAENRSLMAQEASHRNPELDPARHSDDPTPNTPVGHSPTPVATLPENHVAISRDSLTLLRQRLTYLDKKARDGESASRQLAEKDDALRKKEAEARTLQTKITEGQNQLQSIKADRDRIQKEKTTLEARITSLEADAGKDNARRKSLNDSLVALNKDIDDLDAQILKRDAQIRREITTRDSLAKAIDAGKNRENDLARQNTLLQGRIDSLSRYALPETDQERFLRDRWAKLDELQKELNARAATSTDQDKLLAQRQAYIEGKEKDLAAREGRIVDLEAREQRLKLREQQLDTRENISGIAINPTDIRESTVVEFGSNVPVFTAATALSVRAAQKQVVAYMLSRDILLDSQFPDLIFRNVYLPELGTESLEVKVRVDARGEGSVIQVSFMLPDRNYMGTEKTPKQNDIAKQLIVKMLRYKP